MSPLNDRRRIVTNHFYYYKKIIKKKGSCCAQAFCRAPWVHLRVTHLLPIGSFEDLTFIFSGICRVVLTLFVPMCFRSCLLFSISCVSVMIMYPNLMYIFFMVHGKKITFIKSTSLY